MAKLGTRVDKKYEARRQDMLSKRLPIVEQCTGPEKSCNMIDKGTLCSAYIKPESKWRNGSCPLASHLETVEEKKKRKRVGQQKHA